MQWSKPPGGSPAKPKRLVLADKSPQNAPVAPAWMGKNPPVIAQRAKQKISLPPPAPRQSDRPRMPSMAPVATSAAAAVTEAAPHAPEPVAAPLYEVPQPSVEEVESLAALRQALTDIGSLREVIFAQTERQLVELAVTIARQVIAHEISMEPGLLLGLAREGIKALDEKDKIVVKFGAALDDELVMEFTEALRKDAPRCEVQIDPSMGPRECIVETELGRVDESVETRLYHVLEALVP